MRFKNKVAVINGGGRGIGKATALLFAREGASVVITGRRKIPLEETISQIRNLHENAVFVTGDVSKMDDAQLMIKKAIETFGRLDILVNNAGVNYKPGTTLENKHGCVYHLILVRYAVRTAYTWI